MNEAHRLIQFLTCYIQKQYWWGREGMAHKIVFYYRAQCVLNMENLSDLFFLEGMHGRSNQTRRKALLYLHHQYAVDLIRMDTLPLVIQHDIPFIRKSEKDY